MELILGASISPDSVYEGGDVYFDCRIQSRPPPKKIIWQFDVSLSFVRSLTHSIRSSLFGESTDRRKRAMQRNSKIEQCNSFLPMPNGILNKGISPFFSLFCTEQSCGKVSRRGRERGGGGRRNLASRGFEADGGRSVRLADCIKPGKKQPCDAEPIYLGDSGFSQRFREVTVPTTKHHQGNLRK